MDTGTEAGAAGAGGAPPDAAGGSDSVPGAAGDGGQPVAASGGDGGGLSEAAGAAGSAGAGGAPLDPIEAQLQLEWFLAPPPEPPAACQVSCPTASCGLECPGDSYPCDSGCCQSTLVGPTQMPDGYNHINNTSLFVDADDKVHLGYSAVMPYYAISSDDSFTDPTLTVEELPFKDFHGDPTFNAQASTLHLAVDSEDVAHVAFRVSAICSPPIVPGWYARRSAGTWSHQALDFTVLDLALDADVPTVLSEDAVWQRTDGDWVEAPIPLRAGSEPRFLAVDAGNWFVLTEAFQGPPELYFRGTAGEWGVERPAGDATGEALALALQGGTAHVAFADPDGSLWYARRDANEWTTTRVPFGEGSAVEAAMTLDDCGRPYFNVWATHLWLEAPFHNSFVRWTQAGFRHFELFGSCSFGDGPSIALTSERVFIAHAGCTADVASLPRADD